MANEEIIQKIFGKRKELESLQREKLLTEGKIQALYKQLEDMTGSSSIQEAKNLLDRKSKELAAKKASLDRGASEWVEKYGSNS